MAGFDQPDSSSHNDFSPQLGGEERAKRRAQLNEAARFFLSALEDIEDGYWAGARAALLKTLEIMPEFPHAQGLLSLVDDIAGAAQPDFDQVSALQAYARKRLAAISVPQRADPVDSPAEEISPSTEPASPLPPVEFHRPPEEPRDFEPEQPPAASDDDGDQSIDSKDDRAQTILLWDAARYWRLVYLMFYSPARFLQADHLLPESLSMGLGGWLFGSLLSPSVYGLCFLIAVKLTAAGFGVWPWAGLLLVIVLLGFLGWMAANGFTRIAFTLMGALVMLVMIFAMGELSLWLALPLTLLLALNLGVALPFLKIEAQEAAQYTAGGMAAVPATILMALGLFFLLPVSAQIIAPTPLGGRALFEYLGGAIPAIVPFAVGFWLFYGIFYLILMGIGFGTAYSLEASPENQTGKTLRLVILGSLLLLNLLILVGGAFTLVP